MKRLYTRIKFIKFNNRRSRRTILRKTGQTCKRKTKRSRKGKKLANLTAPTNFSIIRNAEETIRFFNNLSDQIYKKMNIFLHLDNITDITPDAIVYLLLLLHEANKRHIYFRGTAPKSDDAKEIFLTSGFYDHVKSKLDKASLKNNKEILSVKYGNSVDGDQAENVQQFLFNYLPDYKELKEKKPLYSILVECMANTNEYAAETKGLKTWWTMGLHDKKKRKVLFAFVDNGVGIPHTVRKKWTVMTDSDAVLLEKTVSGKCYMVSGKQNTRNRGLPQIKSFCKGGFLDSLIFVSSNGYYSVADNKTEKLKHKFSGTLITWEFSEERHGKDININS